MSTERALIERAMLGDADATARLVESYRPLAFRVAVGVLGDADIAEDVAQDAMVRLQASLPGFHGSSELSTWVHRIALNLSYDVLRSRRRRERDETVEVLRERSTEAAPDPHAAVDAERARLALQRALDRLPPDQREILVLRFLSELSYAEIARTAGIPEGTVASRIFRALKRLGSEIEAKHLEVIR